MVAYNMGENKICNRTTSVEPDNCSGWKTMKTIAETEEQRRSENGSYAIGWRAMR